MLAHLLLIILLISGKKLIIRINATEITKTIRKGSNLKSIDVYIKITTAMTSKRTPDNNNANDLYVLTIDRDRDADFDILFLLSISCNSSRAIMRNIIDAIIKTIEKNNIEYIRLAYSFWVITNAAYLIKKKQIPINKDNIETDTLSWEYMFL